MSTKVTVVEPSGILDSTKADAFRQQIEKLLDGGAETILVDLKNVTFIDSSGLGTLVLILKKVRSSKRNFYICSINDQVKMLFELTNMNRVFDIFDSREAFETAGMS